MTRFRFSLERVLRVRGIEQEVARAEWAAAEAAVAGAERELGELRAAIAAAERELLARQSRTALRPRDVLSGQSAIDAVRARLPACAERLRRLRRRADERLLAWRDCRARERGLKVLREGQRESHLREAERAENARIDELASARHARPPQGSSLEGPSADDPPAFLPREPSS